jgi:hypothetical protein
VGPLIAECCLQPLECYIIHRPTHSPFPTNSRYASALIPRRIRQGSQPSLQCFSVPCNMMHIQMLSEAALPLCPLTGRTYTARAATCGPHSRLIIANASAPSCFLLCPLSHHAQVDRTARCNTRPPALLHGPPPPPPPPQTPVPLAMLPDVNKCTDSVYLFRRVCRCSRAERQRGRRSAVHDGKAGSEMLVQQRRELGVTAHCTPRLVI